MSINSLIELPYEFISEISCNLEFKDLAFLEQSCKKINYIAFPLQA